MAGRRWRYGNAATAAVDQPERVRGEALARFAALARISPWCGVRTIFPSSCWLSRAWVRQRSASLLPLARRGAHPGGDRRRRRTTGDHHEGDGGARYRTCCARKRRSAGRDCRELSAAYRSSAATSRTIPGSRPESRAQPRDEARPPTRRVCAVTTGADWSLPADLLARAGERSHRGRGWSRRCAAWPVKWRR